MLSAAVASDVHVRTGKVDPEPMDLFTLESEGSDPQARIPDMLSDLLREQLGDMHTAIDIAMDKQQAEFDLTRVTLKHLCDVRQTTLEAVVRSFLSSSKHNKIPSTWTKKVSRKSSPCSSQRAESSAAFLTPPSIEYPVTVEVLAHKARVEKPSISNGKAAENSNGSAQKAIAAVGPGTREQGKCKEISGDKLPERKVSTPPEDDAPEKKGSTAMRQLFQDMQRQTDVDHPIYKFFHYTRGEQAAAISWTLLKNGCLPVFLKQRARKVCEHKAFHIFVPTVIVANIVLVCISAHLAMLGAVKSFDHGHDRIGGVKAAWEPPLDVLFALFFTFEIAVKLLAYELTFFLGPDWNWNILDVVCALSSWSDVLLTTISMPLGGNIALFRALRALRLVKALRIVRVIRVFSGLRLLVLSVMSLIVPLVWAIAFMVLILLAFAVTFQFGVAEFLLSGQSERVDPVVPDNLISMFQDLGSAIVTLLKAITGGDDWTNIYSPLRFCGLGYGLLFILYISLMAFGILNSLHECAPDAFMDFAEVGLIPGTKHSYVYAPASGYGRPRTSTVIRLLRHTDVLDVHCYGIALSDENESWLRSPRGSWAA